MNTMNLVFLSFRHMNLMENIAIKGNSPEMVPTPTSAIAAGLALGILFGWR